MTGEYYGQYLYAGTSQIEDDSLLAAYRNPVSRDAVSSYVADRVKNPTVAQALLKASDRHGIDPALLVALAWQESRFRVRAVGKNTTTVDRGLLQLNSRTFSHVPLADFFDPHINADLGAEYLRSARDRAGNDVAALAMYNAGTGRVHGSGTPRQTLDYVSRVLEYRDDMVAGYRNHADALAGLAVVSTKNVKDADSLIR